MGYMYSPAPLEKIDLNPTPANYFIYVSILVKFACNESLGYKLLNGLKKLEFS